MTLYDKAREIAFKRLRKMGVKVEYIPIGPGTFTACFVEGIPYQGLWEVDFRKFGFTKKECMQEARAL